jgi:ubiquinone/menaquinone biosynthesis C-methylase UbiE
MKFYSQQIFPRVMDMILSTGEFSDLRKSLLAEVSGDVFEIGFGTGLNLPHYPSHVKRITTADPNRGAHKLAKRRIAQSSIEVVHLPLSGEHLNLPDESFNSVVCTFTMCSIPDADSAMSEMRRILRTGGRMFFIEHGLSDDPRIQKWQHRLNPLNKIIGDGCNLNRVPTTTISKSGLRMDRLDTFYLKKAPKYGGFIYRGVAVK